MLRRPFQIIKNNWYILVLTLFLNNFRMRHSPLDSSNTNLYVTLRIPYYLERTKAVLRKPLIKPILSHETTPLRLALYTFGDGNVQQVQEVPPGKRHGCTRILAWFAMPDFSA